MVTHASHHFCAILYNNKFFRWEHYVKIIMDNMEYRHGFLDVFIHQWDRVLMAT